MISNYKIEFITINKVLELRQKNLKPFLTLAECKNSEDDNVLTKHFGIFYNNNCVSVATVFPESHKDFQCGNPYRLRGMATDSQFRGQGFGSILLMHAFDYLKDIKCDLLWCNARLKALNFYKQNGFHAQSEIFELPQIGPHIVMYKRIIPK